MLSARLDSGDQKPMRYLGAPNVNGGFLNDFVGLNLNVSDAELRYEDDALRAEANWQATDTVSVEAETYELATDRFYPSAGVVTSSPENRGADRGAEMIE